MKAKLIQFNDIDEFKKRCNNFPMYFLDNGNICSEAYRSQKCFRKFAKTSSKLERELTKKITSINEITPVHHHNLLPKEKQDMLPWEKLLGAYNLISEYVDKAEAKDDAYFIIR